MHELAITQAVVDTVLERVPDATITCVRLDIGALSGVVPDSVRSCFDLVTEGTSLAGARLEITHCAGRCVCHACGAEFKPDDLIALCPCAAACPVAPLSTGRGKRRPPRWSRAASWSRRAT